MNSGKGYGGPTSLLFYFLSFLDRKRFDPLVAFYFLDSGPDIVRIRSLGVPVVFLNAREEPGEYVPVPWLLGPSRSLLAGRTKTLLRLLLRLALLEVPTGLKLAKLIRKERIDAVVLNNDVHYHVAGVLGTRLAGAPCICRKAGGIGEGKLIKKVLVPQVSLFIAVSRATEEDQRSNNPGTRRLATVYEGINLDLFQPESCAPNTELKAEFGIPPSSKVVISVSRLDTGKGHKELLDAAALVRTEFPEVAFLVVGDGPTLGDLKTRAEALRLRDSVIFAGWRQDIPSVLSISDIFIHCPTTFLEGLGIANLEAMAMGKPTIVSRNGGLPDAVVDGVTGYVVPPGDVQGMAAAIVRLLRDGELARRLGQNARRRTEELFDMKKNIFQMERLFAQIIERNC